MTPPSRGRVLDPAGRDVTGQRRVELVEARFQLRAPVMAELDVPQILDRDELRAACDRYRTPARIAGALIRGRADRTPGQRA